MFSHIVLLFMLDSNTGSVHPAFSSMNLVMHVNVDGLTPDSKHLSPPLSSVFHLVLPSLCQLLIQEIKCRAKEPLLSSVAHVLTGLY